MVLVDTSIWIDHLRKNNDQLYDLLWNQQVVIHPMIIGELACGTMSKRKEVLTLLKSLPSVSEAGHGEVLQFIEMHKLFSSGVTLIDVHLLASSCLANVVLWTKDQNLKKAAAKLKVDFK